MRYFCHLLSNIKIFLLSSKCDLPPSYSITVSRRISSKPSYPCTRGLPQPTALLWWDGSHSSTPHHPSGCTPRQKCPPSLTHPWASTCEGQIKSHLLREASPTAATLLTSSFKGLRLYFLQHIIQPVISQASSFNCHEHHCLWQEPRPYCLSPDPRAQGR